MKPEQIDAIRWLLIKVFDVGSEHRFRTSPEDAAGRRWALRQVIELIESHPAVPADAPAPAMIPRAGRLVRHDDPDVPVTGTLDELSGEVVIKTATHMPDGLIAVEHLGTTRIWWDDQPIARDARGLMIFVDESRCGLAQDQVALRLEDGTLVFPLKFARSL